MQGCEDGRTGRACRSGGPRTTTLGLPQVGVDLARPPAPAVAALQNVALVHGAGPAGGALRAPGAVGQRLPGPLAGAGEPLVGDGATDAEVAAGGSDGPARCTLGGDRTPAGR